MGQWAGALHLEMDREEFQVWKAHDGCFRVASNGSEETYCLLAGSQPVLVTVKTRYRAMERLPESVKREIVEAEA